MTFRRGSLLLQTNLPTNHDKYFEAVHSLQTFNTTMTSPHPSSLIKSSVSFTTIRVYTPHALYHSSSRKHRHDFGPPDSISLYDYFAMIDDGRGSILYRSVSLTAHRGVSTLNIRHPMRGRNMREITFSNSTSDVASVGITTTLYDRRGLDCTSILPLVNSLKNLAYLASSSRQVRNIPTVDGGIERLVCILKEGRSTDTKEMLKWNLAFQCIVNIGVRGSQAVRTRVVQADVVPVIATMLDNYLGMIEKYGVWADFEGTHKWQLDSLGQSRLSTSSSRADPSS